MSLLSKIWSLLKAFWIEFTKEPANNVLDTDVPADEETPAQDDQTKQ